MTWGRRLLVGFGACLLVLLMMTAAFAVGVYIGERGWTKAQRPGPAGPIGPPPPAQPPLAPGPEGAPSLVGVVQGFRGDLLTVRTKEGPRLVLVSRDTRIKWGPEDREAHTSDLRRGRLVAIFGDWKEDRRLWEAHLILILPKK